MKLKISFTLVLVTILTILVNPRLSFAQNQSVSISARYPIPVGDTFYSNYDGIINSGLKYSKSVGASISINGLFNYTRSKITLGSTDQTTTYSNFYTFIVSASRQIKIGNGLDFNPEIGIGYSRLNFKNNQFDSNDSANGFTTELALHLNRRITNKFSLGLISSYNFTLMGELGQALDTAYNRELHWINIGVSAIFHL